MISARGWVATFAAAGALFFAACSAKTVGGGASDPSGLPCAVDRVLAAQCRTCHSSPPAFGAPMPMANWSDLQAPAVSDANKKVFELVGVRTHDARKPMPEPPRARLGAADQKVLDDWIASGAPRSNDSCASPSIDAGVDAPVIHDPPPGCPNVTLAAVSPYEMQASTSDEYVCFGVDVALSKKRHITSFWPKVDNTTISHHALVYLASASESPVPHPCSPATVFGRRLVYAWAPGGEPFELPAEAGLPMDGQTTTHFVVQMHYSNLRHLSNQTDRMAIDLCTTEELRPNDADVMAFGSTKFTIPARKSMELDCSLTLPEPVPTVHLFRSLPHMHQIGSAIGSSRERAGVTDVLDEIKTWNFGSQPWNAVDATLQPGDVVRTWCAWTNGGDGPVSFGPETSDEMCFHYFMFYPRGALPGGAWDAPVRLSTCQVKP